MNLLAWAVVAAGILILIALPFTALFIAYGTASPCQALAQEMLRYTVRSDMSSAGVMGMRLAALAMPLNWSQCGQALADYLGGSDLRDAVRTASPDAIHRMPPRMPTN